MYITKQLLSEYTGRHYQTINNWERSGKIKAYTVQGKKRYDLLECFKSIYGDGYKAQLNQVLGGIDLTEKE
jgi:predicted site-specific integrase-resolvase